ncbi:MAG TPA: hypothetical protein DD725_03435 [Deltaproteobacteria bacterium]|nr:hypothetical protein [Deltaproteobacteria bacterium]
MKRFLLLFAVFVVSLSAYYSPAEAVVHVEGRYWFTKLDSEIQVTEGATIGSEVDALNTLGVDDTENFWEARLSLELGNHKFRYSYMPLLWEGQKNITNSINFAGKTYTADANVESSLEIRYHRLGYRYDIVDRLNNQFGIIFDVKLLDVDAHLRAKTIDVDKSYSATIPLPTIGFGAQIGLPFSFSLGAEVTGVAYGGGNYLVDGEASLNFNPVSFASISGGDRVFDVQVKNKDDKIDFTLKGPFVMVRVGF